MSKPRKLIVTLTVVVFGVGAAAFYFYLRTPRLTPELRGHALAQKLGCFACHGAGATGGVPNPGSDEEEVPAWDGGTSMMYVENENEIREWILFGRPERLRDRPHEDDALLRMPAYEAAVSEKEVDDLVAYYKAVARYVDMPADALEGYRRAGRLGCFGCHGPGGLVGSPNPRSFKGYIPPWRGSDYRDLVRNDDELQAWILDGKIDRLEGNPLATFFTRRQTLQMPAYREHVSQDELEAIMTYITWLQH